MQEPCFIAIGSGKGGVGKSLVAANLGICLAKLGKKTLLVDADFGGANLHTFVGVERPQVTLVDILQKRTRHVVDCIVKTDVAGLHLLSGEGDPWLADPRGVTKKHLVQGIKDFPVDFVICDLPAGSGSNALDFFSTADVGILVVVPEPTSAENAYRFIKSAFLRRLKTLPSFRGIGGVIEKLWAARSYTGDGEIPAPLDLLLFMQQHSPQQAIVLEQELKRFSPWLLVNQTRNRLDAELGDGMKFAGERRLGISIELLGHLESDDLVWQAIRKRKPLLIEYPESKISKGLEKIARRLIAGEHAHQDFIPKPLEAQNFYEVLGVEKGDSEQEIRRSIRRIKDIYDRDSMVVQGLYSAQEIVQMQRKMDEAYATLLDAEKRRKYDLRLFPSSLVKTQVKPKEEKKDTVESLIKPVDEFDKNTEFSGEVLKKIREHRQIGLKEISDRTKIALWQLQAIEEQSLDKMPALVYLKGFLREYAKYLGLPVEQVVKTYLAAKL